MLNSNIVAGNVALGKPLMLLTWRNIEILLVCLIIFHIITILYSICIFWGACKTYIEVGQFIDMISTASDGSVLSVLLILTGCICLPYNIVGIILLFQSHRMVKNERLNFLLYIYTFTTIAIVLILTCMAVAAVAHSYGIHERLGDGIVEAMRKYSSRFDMKIRIDQMQVKFQCCGSKTYKEWFDLQWFDPMLGGAERIEGQTFVADNTPFSCCAMTTLRPCIHHHILNTSKYYFYDPEIDLTISNRGCHDVMIHEARVVGWLVLVTLCGIGILEMGLGFGMRIIQTAHSGLFYFERKSFLHAGWIIGRNAEEKTSQTEAMTLQKLRPPAPPPLPPEWEET